MLGVFLRTVAVGIILYGGYLLFESKFTEQLDYSVVKTSRSDIELRQYAAFIVAEVNVLANNSREAASRGFRPLAGYIFGANKPNEKINMTAPVSTQAKAGEKISMTAPVTTTQGSEGNNYVVQFSMPAKRTMETLPEPQDENIRLVQKATQLRLAKTYRGDPSAQQITEAEQELLRYAKEAGMNILASPIWAGYSSPAVPNLHYSSRGHIIVYFPFTPHRRSRWRHQVEKLWNLCDQ